MAGWRQRRGQQGEQLAVAYLEGQGYRIQAHNYRHRRGEIDIIAWDGATLVFVEVKTKGHTAFGHPQEMVDARNAASEFRPLRSLLTSLCLSRNSSTVCACLGTAGELKSA